jgi:hypothetical protein
MNANSVRARKHFFFVALWVSGFFLVGSGGRKAILLIVNSFGLSQTNLPRMRDDQIPLSRHSSAIDRPIVFNRKMTPIVIICALTVLLFGFESDLRNESNRFQR